MKLKRMAFSLALAASFLALAGCNDLVESKLPYAAKSGRGALSAKGVKGAKGEMAKLRDSCYKPFKWEAITGIQIWNYCCDDGWANMPCTLALHKCSSVGGKGYTLQAGEMDFAELPFEDLGIDKFGATVEWTQAETGNWSGAPKTFNFKRKVNLKEVTNLCVGYELVCLPYYKYGNHAYGGNGGGLRIAFVDKDGNLSKDANGVAGVSLPPQVTTKAGLYKK